MSLSKYDIYCQNMFSAYLIFLSIFWAKWSDGSAKTNNDEVDTDITRRRSYNLQNQDNPLREVS
jgi:hypothetical protein